MRRKLMAVVNLMVAIVFALGLVGPVAAQSPDVDGPDFMPPNPEKILAALIQRGVVPADASPAEKDAALQSYLQLKLADGMDRDANPLARKKLDAFEESQLGGPSSIRGKKLGSTTSVPASTPQYQPLEGTDNLLMILIEFADMPYTWTTSTGEERTEAGPLHNQIALPDNDFDLWVPDFDTQHYEDMMFTPGGFTFPEGTPNYAGQKRGSMRDYYLEQSYGKYTVDGKTYGWYTVDKPEAYYGDDDPEGGNDDLLPGTPHDLLADAVDAINASDNPIDWLAYDLADPYDLDGDGIVAEPDCIVDHPLFVHAGIDQSGGGGAQGDDSIWAHSSSTWVVVTPEVADGAACGGAYGGTVLNNYTIMPEDGGVGVFAHEFGHDLGLPDEYDTIYSGNGDSVGFWSLMSSGSWLGRPAQTQPSDISIWGRNALGWMGDKIAVIDSTKLTKTALNLRLEQAERWGGDGTINAIRVNLPMKPFYVNTPYSGAWEWFGGKADEIDTTLRRTVDLTGKTSASLSFATWYDIEEEWDFGFVQVSTDGGMTWTSLAIEGTSSEFATSGMPQIAANLPGFTGNSGGWLVKTADLSAYAGQVIQLQFRYMTDWGTSMAGFYVDDISVTADGAVMFVDDVETEDAAWAADGWTRDQGSGKKSHYYMLEWRNLAAFETELDGVGRVNFDNGLSNAYQYDSYGSTPNQPKYFSYAPGLLLWYRDLSYTDNWVGVHPGHGFLLVVDAHPKPLINVYGTPWRNRVQTYDSTFSLKKAPTLTLSTYDKLQTIIGASAVPNFYDGTNYTNPKTPDMSVLLTRYGLRFRVAGQAKDGSAAVIGIGK